MTELSSLNPTLAAQSEAAFGSSVSIDGDRIAVGAPLARVDGFEEAGLVFLISYLDRLDSWFVAELVTAFDPEENKRYGSSVDLRGDLVAIGAVVSRARAGVPRDVRDDVTAESLR